MTASVKAAVVPGEAEMAGLARDRPLATRELHHPNAYYGHDGVLRRYAGLSAGRTLKAAIEHGPVIAGDRIWEIDAQTRMPVFLCASPDRAAQYRSAGGSARETIAVGPLILYARSTRVSPPGDRLLFFPPHSSHHVRARYDFGAVERFLERSRSDWNEVWACIYWRDVLEGHADVFRSLGVECVTAGHMYDPGFLDRLRAIIESCDAVSSTEVGSHIFYSLALERPVTLERQEISYEEGSHVGMRGDRTRAWHDAMARLRRTLEGDPVAADLDWIRELVGTGEHREPHELRAILDDAEQLYRRTYRLPERLAHVGRARAPHPVRQAASWLTGRARRA